MDYKTTIYIYNNSNAIQIHLIECEVTLLVDYNYNNK